MVSGGHSVLYCWYGYTVYIIMSNVGGFRVDVGLFVTRCVVCVLLIVSLYGVSFFNFVDVGVVDIGRILAARRGPICDSALCFVHVLLMMHTMCCIAVRT